MFYIILHSFIYLFSEQLLRATTFNKLYSFLVLVNQMWLLMTGTTLNSCPQISNGCTTLPKSLLHALDKCTLLHSKWVLCFLISLILDYPSPTTSNLWFWLILHWENRSKWELPLPTKFASLQVLSALPPLSLTERSLFPSKTNSSCIGSHTLHFL